MTLTPEYGVLLPTRSKVGVISKSIDRFQTSCKLTSTNCLYWSTDYSSYV
jgi:hypothetical protein